jgi:hypothetical protein
MHPAHARRIRLENASQKMRAARAPAEREIAFAIIARIDREAREHSRDPRWRRTCAAELAAAERFMADQPSSPTSDPSESAEPADPGERVEYEPGTVVERASEMFRAEQERRREQDSERARLAEQDRKRPGFSIRAEPYNSR